MILLFFALAGAGEGTATLTLAEWERMLDAAGEVVDRPAAPARFSQVDRSVEGAFERGVFTGVLSVRVRALDVEGGLRIPVLSESASIASVTLDGRATSLLAEGGDYTVAVDTTGDHVVVVNFFVGAEDVRFVRRLTLQMPPAGPTRVSIFVPETGIDPDLAHGALSAVRAEGGGTRIVGQLDGEGKLDLGWTSQHPASQAAVRTEVREHVLFTLHEALVRGVAAFDVRVLEGEADRLRFRVPAGVEIVDVTGEAVLQWKTEGEELVVVTRWLVGDRASVQVHFQLPVEVDAPLALRTPLPWEGAPISGAMGVQGPAGFSVATRSASGAEPLRDLPAELAALTPNPLLLGFALTGAPDVVLDVTRQAEVALSTTSIDELEAATVLIEDGPEITRMQLHVRNETRPWLAVTLPEGAVLTHARVDGRSIRPAQTRDGSSLLFPLPQSQRFVAGQSQLLNVREGDTLGGLADRFYGDPSRWADIMRQNPDVLGGDGQLVVGQQLRVAPEAQGGVATSRAVIELAWKRDRGAMGLFGARDLALPAMDADVAEIEWHLYVPHSMMALHFGGNLSAWSHLRYDHFRRVQQFLDAALGIRSAWAGSEYSSILLRRKAIFEQEAESGEQAQEVVSAFPLVGEKYRFRKLLPGLETPALSVWWMDRDGGTVARFGAFVAAAALALRWAARRDRASKLTALVALAGLIVVAWFVEGVHRRLVWGADAGLLWWWVRSEWGRLRVPGGTAPGSALDLWTLRNVGRTALVALGLLTLSVVPLLWSTLALVGLAWRTRRVA